MTAPLFKVIKPGLQTTVQDLGRNGFQQYGISPSGAMDPYSLQIANLLVGNQIDEAALEATLIGPSLEALHNVSVAICGGNLSPRIDGQDVPLWKSIVIKKGQVLSFGPCKEGGRAYISMAGGINVPLVLNSKSTFVNGKFGGYEGRALKEGDILHGSPFTVMNRFVHQELIPIYAKNLTVRVILGPHLEKFTKVTIETFLTAEFTISPQSNRMGYQLTGPALAHLNGADIISDAIPLGGIQVPASGQPIILMTERQTTGGYSRIGTVISADIPLLAQALPGTRITFKEVGLNEAQDLLRERNRKLKWLEAGTRACQ
jgi:antagonist of KipI